MTAQQPVEETRGHRLLAQVQEGMSVYDNQDEEVGEVEMVYLGAESQSDNVEPATASQPYRAGEGSVTEVIADVFEPDEIPEAVAKRLVHSGFMRIDGAGLFAADRYVVPSQLTAVSNDEVHLAVSRQELMEDRW